MTIPAPENPSDVGRGVLDQCGGDLDGVGQRLGAHHPVRPEDLLRAHRQCVDLECAGRAVVRHDDLIERRLQRGEDAGDVLVPHHRQHPDEEPEVELLCQRAGECGGAGGIVGGVDEHRRCAAHPLEPARAGRRGESGPHRVDVELPVGRRRRRTLRPRPAPRRRCGPDARHAVAGRCRGTPRRGPAAAAPARRWRPDGPVRRTRNPRGQLRRRTEPPGPEALPSLRAPGGR